MADNLMPGEEGGIPTGMLDKFKNQGNANPVTVDDIQNYNFGLSPEQEQAYNATQEKYTPARPAMSVHDYYPNQGDPIGVGQSSGRIIGSQTQYVPNGALVPIGMWDARDAAVQKAALMKAKDVEDWKKKSAVAPTSKLTNINDNIRKEFFNHQNQSWQQALKASGGDAQKAQYMLQNNPDFQAKNKSFYDQAKMGDAIVEQDAQLEDDVRSGKKVLTPAMVEARKQLHAATNPDSDEFKNFSSAYTSYNAVSEFNNAYNDVVDHMTRQKLAQAGIDESNPDYLREYKSTKENFTPDQLQAQEDALNQMYGGGRGGDLYTPEFIKKQVWGKGSNVREEKSVDAKFKPKENGDVEDLDINNISNEKGSMLGIMAGEGYTLVPDTKEVDGKQVTEYKKKYGIKDQQSTYSQFDGLTLRKSIDVIIPGSADVTDLNTGKKLTNKNVTKAKIGGIYNGYTINGQLVADDSEILKNPEKFKNAKVTPMVAVIFTKKNKEGKDVETTGHLPLKQVENAVRGKNNKNGKVVDEYYNRADERTKELKKGTAEATGYSTAPKSYNVKGKNYTVSAIEKAAKASGMTVQEYIDEVNKQ